MSAIMNLSLKEGAIKDFFEGDNTYYPSSELMYIHTHPLVNPNFLRELWEEIEEVALLISLNNVTGNVLSDLTKDVRRLADLMGSTSIDDSNAKDILEVLREIHKTNVSVKGIYGGKGK